MSIARLIDRTIEGILKDAQFAYDYIIYTDETNVFAFNTKTKRIEFVSNDIGQVLQYSINALNYIGSIKLTGSIKQVISYNLATTVTIGDGTSYLALTIEGEPYKTSPNSNINPVRLYSNGIPMFNINFPAGKSSSVVLKGFDMVFSGNTNTNNIGVQTTGYATLGMEDIGILNAYEGVVIPNGGDNCVFKDVQFLGCGTGFVTPNINQGTNLFTFERCIFQSCNTGLLLQDANQFHFIDCVFEACQYGLDLRALQTLIIDNGWFEGNSQADIRLADYTGASSLYNNKLLIIRDSLADGTAPYFIRMDWTWGRLFHLILENCYINKSSTQYITYASNTAAWGNAADVIFSGVFKSLRTNGGQIHGFATAPLGQYFPLIIEDSEISPSQILSGYGNQLPPYIMINYNQGAKTYSSNLRNRGVATFSGNGTATQFTIPHGLVSTPNVAIVTPASANASGAFYITVDATNIYVNYTTAPPAGTNNVVLNWYAEI